MVFLCFSSKDRYEIVESIYYHLSNMGIPVWYDRKEILMGDNRNHKNFIEGVFSCRYAIIILSPNSINSICANEEIELIYQQYTQKKIWVFPVFFNIHASCIPSKYEWMLKLVYKELDVSNDSRGLCNHVICKYLLDKIEYCKYKSIFKLSAVFTGYINTLLTDYLQLDGYNFNSRITLLYCVISYFKQFGTIPECCLKGINYLFEETKLNLPMDLRETSIFEYLFILSANYFLHCSSIEMTKSEIL